jgi:hypothetical protein
LGLKETHQWRKGKPAPEGHKKAEPRKEKDSSIHIDGIQKWNGSSLAGDRIDLRRPEREPEIDSHYAGWYVTEVDVG